MDTQAWYDNLAEPVKKVFDRILEFLPNLVGALALVLIGWVVARLLGMIARRLTTYALRRLGHTGGFETGLESQGRFVSGARLFGALVFWTIFLFFIAAGIEALGLPAVSDLFGAASAYVPRVLLAAAVMLAGILLGEAAWRWVAAATARAGIARGQTLGRAAQGVVFVVAAIIAVDQLGVESAALMIALAITAGSVLGATALAFGIGAGTTVSNVLAAHELHRTHEVGESIRLGELEGEIVEISRTSVILKTPQGRAVVPAKRFSEETSVVLPTRGAR